MIGSGGAMEDTHQGGAMEDTHQRRGLRERYIVGICSGVYLGGHEPAFARNARRAIDGGRAAHASR